MKHPIVLAHGIAPFDEIYQPILRPLRDRFFPIGAPDELDYFSRDFRFGHPDTVRVLPSAARMQDLGSPLTVDAPFAPDSVAECRFIAAFQLAGGLFADTAP